MARKSGTPPNQLGNHAIGYGRPPVHTRFKPGQSGNPVGRPKGATDLRAALVKALNEKVVVTEGGRRRKITKVEAAAKQLANKAASGDSRVLRLLREMSKASGNVAASPDPLATTESPALPPQKPAIDFSKMTTKQLVTIHEAMLLLRGTQGAPRPLMPPGDPGEEPS